MKKAILFLSLIISIFAFASGAKAQETETPKDDVQTLLDLDSKRNLDVARQYFKLKKAYKAALARCEETIVANPTFAQIDEVLYISGMSSYYLANNKGKQKVDLTLENEKEKYAPEKLREDAVTYFTQIVEQHPQSKYKDEAEKKLKELKAVG